MIDLDLPEKIKAITNQIIELCRTETPKIIAQLEALRFENNGAFNGHEIWEGNSPKVIKDKGFDEPLWDSGELEYELTNSKNWKLDTVINENGFDTNLTIKIPDKESFTESKYNILDTGGKVNPYRSRRGNWVDIQSVPARPFRELSTRDVEWIKDRLEEAIVKNFAS